MFRVPIIVETALTGVCSAVLPTYSIDTRTTTRTIEGLNVAMSIVASGELYFNLLQTKLETNFVMSRDYYISSVGIYDELQLSRVSRKEEPSKYLEECLNECFRLFSMSSKQRLDDGLQKSDEIVSVSPSASACEDEVGA